MANSYTKREKVKWFFTCLVRLCFNCWTIWHGHAHCPDPEIKSNNCPCCNFITIALRSEEIADENGWYTVLQNQGKGIESLLKSDLTALDWRESARSPLFLQLHFFRDWSHERPIWISYENNEAHRHRLACREPAITFDIPDQVSESLLRSWMTECDTHGHAPAVGEGDDGRSQQVPNILLVDVQQRMLVECPLPPEDKTLKYLALSYVWGSKDFFKTTKGNIQSLLLPGGLEAPHVSLPKTFLDAMQLVDLIGGRYVWIDALCIVQDNQIKHNQLQIMDQIYGRAYMTIVCLAGNSAHFGLPGLNPNTRTRRPWTCHFDNGFLYEGLHSLEQSIRGSTHYTRAWTFQGTFLSRRCLFISEGRYFFRCSRSSHAESLDWQARIPSPLAFELGLNTSVKTYWHEGIFFDSVEH
ncbi:HET-domain-containing protein [Karstenula rhodostoma CBS 690.94]|uniref:HET-domain-containing protein n=1 Tax=Karstenula rhodostoma CBS 690.94 TaxID=1392251 RepID=A0A9P4PTU0_9PLEO|nr:HET-domain-containing protein [Karstenula rhodostoma CBS 690.94]